MLSVGGHVTYEVDGNEVYSGAAATNSLAPLLLIGDSSWSAHPDGGITTGSLMIDEVTIITHIPEPATLFLLAMGVAGLLIYGVYQRR